MLQYKERCPAGPRRASDVISRMEVKSSIQPQGTLPYGQARIPPTHPARRVDRLIPTHKAEGRHHQSSWPRRCKSNLIASRRPSRERNNEALDSSTATAPLKLRADRLDAPVDRRLLHGPRIEQDIASSPRSEMRVPGSRKAIWPGRAWMGLQDGLFILYADHINLIHGHIEPNDAVD
nr:hypothetical protein CFP56_34727 [Quercus suber]